MIKRSEFYFTSCNGTSQIRGMVWKPEREVKAILQISHGMIEHIERYHDFALYLAYRGILVVGNDHLGHGKSVQNQEDWGYFGKDGSKMVVKDLYKITKKFRHEYPGIKYFVLGHSMGSFMIRRYSMTYGEQVDGVIIMGTGNQPLVKVFAGKYMIKLLSFVYGERHRSPFMDRLMFGAYQKYFKGEEVESWLTKDADIVKQYKSDPACSFLFTLNGLDTLFSTILFIRNKYNVKKFPKDLPVFITSGEKDPVGNMGREVRKVYQQYKNMGIEDITMKLYPEDRHEILNETNRNEVYQDLYQWISDHIES